MSTDAPPAVSPPGSVQAATILLYVGGGLTVLYAMTSLLSGSASGTRAAVSAATGLVFIGLAIAMRQRRSWARRVVLILCGTGVALAGVSLIEAGVPTALSALGWPVVYAILLNTAPARAWFRRPA